MRKRIVYKIALLALLLTGLASVIYGSYQLYMDYKFKKNGTVTKGTIVDFYFETHYEKMRRTGRMVSYYHPVIDFTANDGKIYHFTDYSIENRSFGFNKMMIGKKVDVVYFFSGNEIECKINSDRSSISNPFIFIAAGGFMALIAILVYNHINKNQ